MLSVDNYANHFLLHSSIFLMRRVDLISLICRLDKSDISWLPFPRESVCITVLPNWIIPGATSTVLIPASIANLVGTFLSLFITTNCCCFTVPLILTEHFAEPNRTVLSTLNRKNRSKPMSCYSLKRISKKHDVQLNLVRTDSISGCKWRLN